TFHELRMPVIFSPVNRIVVICLETCALSTAQDRAIPFVARRPHVAMRRSPSTVLNRQRVECPTTIGIACRRIQDDARNNAETITARSIAAGRAKAQPPQ